MEQISTKTSREFMSLLQEAWSDLAAAINASAQSWEKRTLESEDPDADAWSPRLAAWHVITGERIRTAYLQHLIAERPTKPVHMMAYAASTADLGLGNETLRAEFLETKSLSEMLVRLSDAQEQSVTLLAALSDEDLSISASLTSFMHEYLRGHGQEPSDDVRGVLLHGAVHLRDHARHLARSLE